MEKKYIELRIKSFLKRINWKNKLMSIEDLLLGIAIGNAFGAGVEFQDRDWIKTKY